MSRRSLLGRLGLTAVSLLLPVLAGCPAAGTSGKGGPTSPAGDDQQPKRHDTGKGVTPPKHDPPDR